MIAPERWYEHQKQYQQYGLDMKPEPQRRMRSDRNKHVRKLVIPSGAGKKMAFSTVLAIGAAMIMLIIITAYAANLRYDINSMIKDNQATIGEIENLQVKLCSANNVDYIEGKAVGTMKMVYPKDKNKVYLSADDMPERGFADIIKEKAYN